MAPSSRNYTLIALLVALAVVAPSLLHQSAAARDGGAANKAAAAAPAPSANGEVVLHPSATYEIPDLPLPRFLPCPPVFPKIPFIPCYNVTPPAAPPRPKECRTSLVKSLVLPCSGFLTNSSSAPPEDPGKTCCAGVSLFMGGGDPAIYAPLCLCHVVNSDVNQLLPAPVNHARALSLVQACLGIDPKAASGVCDQIKDETPPIDLPKPPPPAPGNMA